MQPDRNDAPQPKDSDKPPVYRNWRHRKADIARRQAAAEEALARSQASMKWRQDLIDSFIAELGGSDRITPVQRQDCERCADMEALATNMRRRLLRGDTTVKIDELARLEGACDRARRRLNLPAPGPSKVSRYGKAEPVPTLQDYFANQQGEDE
jgi:hypothetical protein